MGKSYSLINVTIGTSAVCRFLTITKWTASGSADAASARSITYTVHPTDMNAESSILKVTGTVNFYVEPSSI